MRMVDPAVLAVATPPAATTAPMAAAPKRIMASPGASFTLSEIAAAVDTSVVVAKFNQLQDTIRTALETRQAYRESLASISIDIGRLIDHLINEGRRLAFALRDVETNYKLELATDADIARATREIGELETRIPELEREDPNNSRIGILRSDLAAKQATLKALENPVEQRYQLERERSISTHGTQTAQLKKQVGLLKQQQQSRVSGISQESDRIAEALAERHQVVQILGTIQSRIAVQQEGLQAEREAITEALTGQPQRVAPRGLFGPVHDLSDQDVVALTMAVDSGEIVSIIDTIFETSPVIESFTALGEYLRDPNSSLNIEAIRTFIAGLAGDQAQFREILGRAMAGDQATKVQAFAAITEPLEAALVDFSNMVAGKLLADLGDPPVLV
ncbi:hypothetical protein A3J44_06255 [candidate division WOR-1 bacterium RIFCSPHIGHO2_02_FULL_45_12]|nr:MAG: hypothetical protein A3J44_06255 [candidate division WOR-1 bacterium RIFCSPHIGHO2_02_FULL_45_12]